MFSYLDLLVLMILWITRVFFFSGLDSLPHMYATWNRGNTWGRGSLAQYMAALYDRGQQYKFFILDKCMQTGWTREIKVCDLSKVCRYKKA